MKKERNYVAKHMNTFCKSRKERDRTKYFRKTKHRKGKEAWHRLKK